MNEIKLRCYQESDIPEIVELFTRSVHKIASNSYSEFQIASWAPLSPDILDWRLRFSGLETYVATIGSNIAGFISIKAPSHIELLYTHPIYSRCGIATALYRHAISQLSDSEHLITTDASIEAKPFFERQGLFVVEEEQVKRNGEVFRRFRMASLIKPVLSTGNLEAIKYDGINLNNRDPGTN